MVCMLLGLPLLTACDNNDWDEYVGKPYNTKLTILPEYGIKSDNLWGIWFSPCFYAIDEQGDTLSFHKNQINGFTFEEGNTYTVQIHAQPSPKEAVWADAPPYTYSLVKLYGQQHVGIDESTAHEEVWQMTDSLVDVGHGKRERGYNTTNAQTGEAFELLRGEVIGFEPVDDDKRHTYTVRVRIYPQQKPTNPINHHLYKIRLVELLDTTELP